MAVSRAPKRPSVSQVQVDNPASVEKEVLKVIQRGGSVPTEQATLQVISTPVIDEVKNVQLRIYQSTLEEIDDVRRKQARGRRPASRHAWILAAVEEKLKKER